jgi:TRAP-type mannitol/chloroaromatic compound transport system permease large subunit
MSLTLLGLFFLMSFLGIPLAISLGLSVITTVIAFDLPVTIVTRLMYTSMNSFLLVAVPLFILAGSVMEKGGSLIVYSMRPIRTSDDGGAVSGM